jgi:hypothetical protein
MGLQKKQVAGTTERINPSSSDISLLSSPMLACDSGACGLPRVTKRGDKMAGRSFHGLTSGDLTVLPRKWTIYSYFPY